jgi:hypothetical protein
MPCACFCFFPFSSYFIFISSSSPFLCSSCSLRTLSFFVLIYYFLHLGESQELLIMNELIGFPYSLLLMCWTHGGGGGVVDCVLFSHNLLPFINHFYVSPTPLPDHDLISLSLQDGTPLPPHPSLGPTPHFIPLRLGRPRCIFYPSPKYAPLQDPIFLTLFLYQI